MNKHSRGFTLIELLVVIAVIGLLASIVLIALNSARAKARDNKRANDLKQIQLALELYYDKTGDYPRLNQYWQCSCTEENCSGGWFSILQPLVDEGFVSILPSDPVNTADASEYLCYEYLARSDNGQSSWFCDGIRRTDFEYVLLFSSETTDFDLPKITAGTTAYDYCLTGPLK